MPNPQDTNELLSTIDNEAEDLTPWELGFVADLIDNPPEQFTGKQAAIVRQIYDRRVK